MTIRAAAVTAGLAVAVLAPPDAAGAATLKLRPAQACYGTADRVTLAGAGFTPSRSVNVLRDGKILNRRKGRIDPIVTDRNGRFAVVAKVPDLTRATQSSTYSAVDRANRATRASVRVRLSDLRVTIEPGDAAANRPRRIRARGFTARGRTLYGHVVRRKMKRTFRVGRLRDACRTVSAVRRLFGKNATRGTYRVQFDTFSKYKSTRRQRVVFTITIRRVTRSAAAGVAAITSQTRALAN